MPLASLSPAPDRQSLRVEWLGRVPYGEALRLQQQAVEACRANSGGDRLLLLEHPPVITLGRSARAENLLVPRSELEEGGVEVYEVARGGDVTYHAPGQLVGYPILDLRSRGLDVHSYLRGLEGALIEALGALGVPALRIAGKTGVFVESRGGAGRRLRKIASIGVGVRHWITLHGFALNVSLDLAGFEAIVPCGLHDVEMTSLARERERSGVPIAADSELGAEARAAVERALVERFA